MDKCIALAAFKGLLTNISRILVMFFELVDSLAFFGFVCLACVPPLILQLPSVICRAIKIMDK